MSKVSNWNRSLLSKHEKVKKEKEQKEHTKNNYLFDTTCEFSWQTPFFKLQNNN